MRVLLDTQIALWALTDSPRLSEEARSLILEPSNDIYFSAASIWEIAIKHRLARHDMPVAGEEAVYIVRPEVARCQEHQRRGYRDEYYERGHHLALEPVAVLPPEAPLAFHLYEHSAYDVDQKYQPETDEDQTREPRIPPAETGGRFMRCLFLFGRV